MQTQPPAGASELRVVWEVKNRFRLFRDENDFLRHVSADRGDGLLAAEQRLAKGPEGRGWARLMLNSLCIDAAGKLLENCERDGVKESYFAPADYRVGVLAANAGTGATCAWSFEAVDEQPRTVNVPCEDEVKLRVRAGTPTVVGLNLTAPNGATQRATTEILVRDLLIAGVGDSIASGDGNPDRAVALDDDGFCFRRLLGGSEYFRPGRAGYRGNKACEVTPRDDKVTRDWALRGAGWMSAACHQSLYSYQVRTALALAIESPHAAVTFVPLACTGAEIDAGLFNSRRAREVTCGGRGRSGPCPSSVPAQLTQMGAVLKAARRTQPDKAFDLVLLTVGANDIRFSEMVADVILDASAERTVLARSGGVSTVEEAEATLRTRLPAAFAKLRGALKPLVGGNLARVVYVAYANPALQSGGATCDGGRDGVDVHPAFTIDAQRLAKTITFMDRQFLPAMRALALCEDGVICGGQTDRMTFVDAHQRAFADHGFCVRVESDPAFDNDCFSPEGTSFQSDLRAAIEKPLACGRSAREFRPYASRARWIRTPNDSYFTSMTYPDGLPSTMQPADIHDAVWGVLSAVYGGAMHPTAEGHAVMADAALPAAREALGLGLPEAIKAETLPPPTGGPTYPARAVPIQGAPPGQPQVE
jgi:lysophospholipase L1-like esterase